MFSLSFSCKPEKASRTKDPVSSEESPQTDQSVQSLEEEGVRGGGQSFGGGIVVGEEGLVDITRIVDPKFRSYREKITIPKNYDGRLYLSGTNIISLRDRFIKVRFRFGRDLTPITVDAVIGRAEEGPTPETNVVFIVLDLSDKPFERVRTLYNLFDYNNYWDETSNRESKEPVSDPRDMGLYCRGLNLRHDPTFEATESNAACEEAGEKCLYAYAKIKDRGLVAGDGSTSPVIVDRLQVASSTSGRWRDETAEKRLAMCLPDSVNPNTMGTLLGLDSPPSSVDDSLQIYKMVHDETGRAVLGLSSLDDHSVDSQYLYRGPFRVIARDSWAISSDAIFSPVSESSPPLGLFQRSVGNTQNPDRGYHSFLFPRATKLELKRGVEHLSNRDPFGNRELLKGGLLTGGTTEFMEGCNKRVQTYNEYNNEDISSCNVTALIEILYEDEEGREILVDSSRKLKLQLIRASRENDEGRETLATALKRCHGLNDCARDECCLNGTCWEKSSVGNRCLDNGGDRGHGRTGESCETDHDCASLCCDDSTSTCAVHSMEEGATNRVLCSKAPGQTCVGNAWCREDNVTKCFKVATGVRGDGTGLCALRCYTIPTFGACVSRGGGPSRCRAPRPVYQSVDMSSCEGSIEPPTSIEMLKLLERGEGSAE